MGYGGADLMGGGGGGGGGLGTGGGFMDQQNSASKKGDTKVRGKRSSPGFPISYLHFSGIYRCRETNKRCCQ